MGTVGATYVWATWTMGGVAKDNRQFINGVFWILCTGAPWRDLPPCYGKRECGRNCLRYWWMSLILNGWWLTPAIARCILTQQGPKAAIKTWAGQKGAQHPASPCRGCKWYAGQNTYYRGYQSWLQRSCSPDWGNYPQGRCWLTGVMILTKSLPMPLLSG